MEQIPSLHEPSKKKSNAFLRIFPWIGTALFFVVTAVGVFYYVTVIYPEATSDTTTGSTKVVSNGKTTVSAVVCNDAIVSTYNAALKLEVRTANAEPTLDVATLAKLDADIRSKAGFDQDPTCQTILFWAAIIGDNTTKASTALKAVQTLHEKRLFADTTIENITSISVMKDSLNAAIAGPRT
jgi:hypothetical protein